MKLVNLLKMCFEILGIFWIHIIISGHIKIKYWMSCWRTFDPHFSNSPHVVLCTHSNWSCCLILCLLWIYPHDKCEVNYWAIIPTCLIICLLGNNCLSPLLSSYGILSENPQFFFYQTKKKWGVLHQLVGSKSPLQGHHGMVILQPDA